MRRREMLAGLAGLAAGAKVAGGGVAGGVMADAQAAAAMPVVLELFTSEACSSCPPADALLGVLAAQPAHIALAWHVDYWNGPAWTDRFATPFATDRQRAYAAALRQEVYTPAMVIDGQALVVGSDARAVAAAIATSAALPVPVGLARRPGGLQASIGALADGALADRARAVLAFYDPRQSRFIGGGENSGRQLREFNVVRAAMTLDRLSPSMALPGPPPGQGAVLLVQAADLRVIGAAAREP